MATGGDEAGDLLQGVGDGGDRRTPIPKGRTPVGVETRGLRVSRLDSRGAVEGLVITGGGFGGASSSTGGSGDRLDPPLRDSARGKDPLVVEETSRDVPVKQPEFVPSAGSSGHLPISKSDFVEYVRPRCACPAIRGEPWWSQQFWQPARRDRGRSGWPRRRSN